MRFPYLIICITTAFNFSVHAQVLPLMPVSPITFTRPSPPVQDVFNVIVHASELDAVFERLLALKRRKRRQVNIVQIGDSHLQAGSLAACVRKPLQQYFGNGGRGLVFPYRMAKSNSPQDLACTSNTAWAYNRLTKPDLDLKPGISGFVIQAGSANPEIDFHLSDSVITANRPYSHVKLYVDPADSLKWSIRSGDMEARVRGADSSGISFLFDSAVFDMRIMGSADASAKRLYGFSLAHSDTGLIYHAIGVNGAQYKHYNQSPLFWKQLPSLDADLYILSLGTNEAQNARFDELEFSLKMDSMVQQLRKIAPAAGILLTTAQDSYLSGKSNEILRRVNDEIRRYSSSRRIPLWDLYKVTNGYKSCYYWNARGYLSRDRVHFTNEMYCIQGTLLYTALSKAFNAYLRPRQN